jgi:hypothetical protein
MESDAAAPTPSTEPNDAASVISPLPEAIGADLPPSEPAAPAPRALALPLVAALCLTMLAAGLIIGYTGHPIVTAWIATPTLTPSPTPQPASPTQTAEAELAQRRVELMDYVAANTRHFRGNPEAAITLIEFSDFQ